MTRSAPTSLWHFLIGGGFIGFWIFWGFMSDRPGAEAWIVWGLFGLVLAAGFYAARLTHGHARYAIWVGIGIAIGILTGAAFMAGNISFIALFVTGAGAGLIVAGIPDPDAPHTARTATPHRTVGSDAASDPPPATTAPPQGTMGRTWEAAPEAYGSQQQGVAGQQQQQGVRVYGDEYR